jgi:hypothetical protein
MMKLTELIGHKLKWVQPHAMRMEYELREGDKIAATLNFRSSFGSFATASSTDGTWTFKRVGFFQTKVTIRESGKNNDLAIFRNNAWSGGGALEFPDGRKYLADTNFWSTRYEFRNEMDEALITCRNIGGLMHLSSEVEIHPLARNLADMPWMTMLGWYLMIMMHMDSANFVMITS